MSQPKKTPYLFDPTTGSKSLPLNALFGLPEYVTAIEKMNQTYGLPVSYIPTTAIVADAERAFEAKNERPANLSDLQAVAMRIRRFVTVMQKELSEGIALAERIESGVGFTLPSEGTDPVAFELPVDEHLELLTELSDWFADLGVYTMSERVKFGLQSSRYDARVMASNFSKLDEHGRPIINSETGKFEKGSNYWKPEPMLGMEIELHYAQLDIVRLVLEQLHERFDSRVSQYESFEAAAEELSRAVAALSHDNDELMRYVSEVRLVPAGDAVRYNTHVIITKDKETLKPIIGDVAEFF